MQIDVCVPFIITIIWWKFPAKLIRLRANQLQILLHDFFCLLLILYTEKVSSKDQIRSIVSIHSEFDFYLVENVLFVRKCFICWKSFYLLENVLFVRKCVISYKIFFEHFPCNIWRSARWRQILDDFILYAINFTFDGLTFCNLTAWMNIFYLSYFDVFCLITASAIIYLMKHVIFT